MLESAGRILKDEGKELKFAELWSRVKADLEITPEEEEQRIGHFYTDLSMSGEFVVLGENTWDLRSRHTYDKVHIDVNDVYSDVDERDTDAADAADEEEYNKYVHGDNVSEEEEGAEPEEETTETKPRENAAELLGIADENY